MAAADDSADKTEQPTPYRLEQARQKGSVAKSIELNGWIALVVGCAFLTMAGSAMVEAVLALARYTFANAARLPLDVDTSALALGEGVVSALAMIAPFLAVMAITAIVANLAQIGGLFAPGLVTPNFTRLNPAEGLKRIFAVRTLFELAKSLIKVAGVACIAVAVFRSRIDELLALAWLNPSQVVQVLGSMAVHLAAAILAFLLVLALADLLFVRRQYLGKMRMSRRDLRDEHKNREGDPEIKARRRRLQSELRKRAESFANVDKADLLLTNPVSLGVLIQYDPAAMPVPRVVGKAQGARLLALRRRALAKGLLVVENRLLARHLFRSVGMYESIPVDAYVEVARLLRESFGRRGKALT